MPEVANRGSVSPHAGSFCGRGWQEPACWVAPSGSGFDAGSHPRLVMSVADGKRRDGPMDQRRVVFGGFPPLLVSGRSDGA